MDDELQKPEPKISLVVGILGLIACIIMDAISFIPGAGDVEEVPALVVLILSFIFSLGGGAIGTQVVVDILKAIPGVQELPLWTPAWLFIWWLENSRSVVAAPLKKAVDLAAVAEGDVEELGESAANTAEEAETLAGTAEQTTEAGTEGAAQQEGKGSSTKSNDQEEGEPNEETSKKNNDRDEMARDAEVDPDEEASDIDFGPPNADESQDDEDEEPEEVADIRKPR